MNKIKINFAKLLFNIKRPFIFLFKTLPHFIKNVWLFKNELNNFELFDWSYPLSMFRRGLELECDYIEKYGMEEDEIRLKKIEKMRRAIDILKVHEDDLFMDLAEKHLGYEYKLDLLINDESQLSYSDKEKNTAIAKKSVEIEDDLWIELLDILDGQDLSTVKTEGEWRNRFDGSGFKTWWD